jgi:pilus assembly protein Flp/PilA
MLHSQYEEGQGLVEYALILVLIAVAVILIMGALGQSVGEIFSDINNSLDLDTVNQTFT